MQSAAQATKEVVQSSYTTNKRMYQTPQVSKRSQSSLALLFLVVERTFIRSLNIMMSFSMNALSEKTVQRQKEIITFSVVELSI